MVPHQDGAPLTRVRGQAQNVHLGLCPSDAPANREQDKAGQVHDLLEGGLDFVCLQETGIRTDRCPPDLASVFEQSGHTILVSGESATCSNHTVAIAVHKQWKVAKVFRLPSSSRCLAVELRRGPHRIFVASIYLPQGLDRIPPHTWNWQHSNTKAEVRRILAEVERWSRPYSVALICGDLNCTMVMGLDSHADRDGGQSGPRPGNLVAATVLSAASPFSDMFRDLWPGEHGWTHGDARLDYVLLKAPSTVLRTSCEVDGAFPSDHEGVRFELGLAGTATMARDPWSRRTFQVHKASPAQRSQFIMRANLAIEALLSEWGVRVAPATTDGDLLLALEWGQRALAETIVEAATATLPRAGRASADRRKQYLRSRITALRRMSSRVKRVASGAISWAHWLRTSEGHENGLRHVGLHPGFSLVDLGAWENWAAAADRQAAALMSSLAELNRSDKGAGTFPERMWRRERGKRSFFDKYFRPSSGSIDSAVHPATGERTWDPKVYMDLVRAAVMRPFSTKVTVDECGDYQPRGCTGACLPGGDECASECGSASIACADIRCSGKAPWWEYWYGPRGRVPGAARAFADVGNLVTPAEVLAAVLSCDGGKSPGLDGVSIDLLKLLARGPSEAVTGPLALPAGDMPVMRGLATLSSMALKLGRMTPHVTKGLIVMVPKGPTDGPADVSQMRPITLLSEIGKVLARVLADRISGVLCRRPELLNISQRAFLRNGDVSQCIAALLDVCEDHKSKRAEDGRAELFCVSYDLSKAYDSVQEYSIRAALERFELPRCVVDYVCSSLWNSTSSVRTRDGPSKPFDVLSSVRQGDPLAPLVFIMVLDVLHCGLDELCQRDGHGVRMRCGPALASVGYADDTAIVADSEAGIRVLHEWVRSFFGAHAFKINAKKTKFVTTANPARVGCLRGVDGRSHIAPLPSRTSFRYLGVLLNLDCKWDDELDRLEKLVWFVRGRILTYRIPLAPAVDAINSFLVPKMEAGLGLISMNPRTVRKLENWTSALKEAALNAAAPPRVAGLSVAGFCTVTDMADLALMAGCFRAASAYERLNVRGRFVTPTTRARYEARPWERAECPNRIFDPPGEVVVQIRRNGGHRDPDEPIVPSHEEGVGLTAIQQVHSEARAWNPRMPIEMFTTATPMTLSAFPDGSTVPGALKCGGYASVIVGPDGTRVELGGHCKVSGANYLSEMTATLATLVSCPAQADLDIHTDCLGGKQAIERDDSAERARIRAAARPVLTCIRRALRCRGAHGARTTLYHVRSHTSSVSFEATGNRLADRRANAERVRALECTSEPFLTGEEMFTAWTPNEWGGWTHVMGDVRRALKWMAKQTIMRRWCQQPRQGATPRTNTSGTAWLCKLVRAESSSALLRFAVLALCQWLPTGRYHGRIRGEDGDQSGRWSCPSCPAAGHETSRHSILCPARQGLLLLAAARARVVAEEAAGRPLGRTSDWPEDVAGRTLTALREALPPGVSAGSAWATCLGLAGLPRLHVRRALRASMPGCDCPAGECRTHGWVVPAAARRALSSAMSLDTSLFATAGDVGERFLQWYTTHPGGPAAGALGSPWETSWGGMFAMCAPRVLPGSLVGWHARATDSAHRALRSPRPTRVVIVTDPSVALPAAPGAVLLHGVRVEVLQNDAAEAMSPGALDPLRRAAAPPALRWTGFQAPHSRPPLTYFWQPENLAHAPPWLSVAHRDIRLAFHAFGAHDRYAGALGVPSPGFSSVLACALSGSAHPDGKARAGAEGAMGPAMLAMFTGAYGAWTHSVDARRTWWSHMSDEVLDDEIEVRDLRAHQRRRAAESKRYAAQVARRRATRHRKAHLAAIAGRMGVTRAALLRDNPEASQLVPPHLARLAPPPAEVGWAGTLRPRPHTRISLDDDYVGADVDRRPRGRSLWRRRAAVARHFGR
jgi:exonuclease III